MDEQQFIKQLIANGWDEESARQEAHSQYNTDEGDCDGDLAEIEWISARLQTDLPASELVADELVADELVADELVADELVADELVVLTEKQTIVINVLKSDMDIGWTNTTIFEKQNGVGLSKKQITGVLSSLKKKNLVKKTENGWELN